MAAETAPIAAVGGAGAAVAAASLLAEVARAAISGDWSLLLDPTGVLGLQGRPKQQATQDIAAGGKNYSDPVIKLLSQGAAKLNAEGVPISSSGGQASAFGPYFKEASDLENEIRWGTTTPTAQQAKLTAETLKNALTELGNPGSGTQTLTGLQQAYSQWKPPAAPAPATTPAPQAAPPPPPPPATIPSSYTQGLGLNAKPFSLDGTGSVQAFFHGQPVGYAPAYLSDPSQQQNLQKYYPGITVGKQVYNPPPTPQTPAPQGKQPPPSHTNPVQTIPGTTPEQTIPITPSQPGTPGTNPPGPQSCNCPPGVTSALKTLCSQIGAGGGGGGGGTPGGTPGNPNPSTPGTPGTPSTPGNPTNPTNPSNPNPLAPLTNLAYAFANNVNPMPWLQQNRVPGYSPMPDIGNSLNFLGQMTRPITQYTQI